MNKLWLLLLVLLVGCEPIKDYNTPITNTKWGCHDMGTYYFIQFVNDIDGIYVIRSESLLIGTIESRFSFKYGITDNNVNITLNRQMDNQWKGLLDKDTLYINDLKFIKL